MIGTSSSITNQKGMGAGRWWGLAALTVSALVLALDTTILVTALPTLSSKLAATTDQLQWMSAAYTLALAGFMLPAGVLGDRFGRRRLLLIGLLLFGTSSVVASQMTSANGLIAMRAIMGAAGAIVLPLTLSILPSMFKESERQRAVAVAGAGAFLGLPLGPLVAGWLLTNYAWGSIFLINGPVVVIAVLGVWFFVPESKDPVARGLDWLGALLEVTGVTGVIYGIIEEPVHGWSDATVAGPIAAGIALLAAFTIWELRTRVPLIDLKLFLKPRFAWSTSAFIVVGFAMTGVLFVLSPYLQVVMGNDAQGTGIRLLPMIGAVIVGALASDPVTKRFGTKIVVTGGLVVNAAGLLLLSTVKADSGYGLVAAGLVVIGFGVAMAMIPALDALLGALPAGETGAGNALTRTLQNIGASFGVAIMGSVLNSAYRANLAGHLSGLPPAAQSAAQSSVAVAAGVAHRLPEPLGAALLNAAQVAYADGMAKVLVVTAGLVLVGAVLTALFLPARAADAGTVDAAPAKVSTAGVAS